MYVDDVWVDDEKREPSTDVEMAVCMSDCSSSQDEDDYMFLCCVYGIFPKETPFSNCLYVKGTTNLGSRIGYHRQATTFNSHRDYYSELHHYIRSNGGMSNFRVCILEEHLFMDNKGLRDREVFHINRRRPKFSVLDKSQGAGPTAKNRYDFMECKSSGN